MADCPDTTKPSRRLFLAAGSAVAVFGSLRAAADDATRPALSAADRQLMLENYQTWLAMELQRLDDELGSIGGFRVNNAGWRYHWRAYGDTPALEPSMRAEAVLAIVGCDWREHQRLTKGGAHA